MRRVLGSFHGLVKCTFISEQVTDISKMSANEHECCSASSRKDNSCQRLLVAFSVFLPKCFLSYRSHKIHVTNMVLTFQILSPVRNSIIALYYDMMFQLLWKQCYFKLVYVSYVGKRQRDIKTMVKLAAVIGQYL